MDRHGPHYALKGAPENAERTRRRRLLDCSGTSPATQGGLE
jgi:hypothetical protein